MEIVAIARVCHLNNVKCLSIKCISDTYEEGGVKEFNKYVVECGNKAFAFLLEIYFHLLLSCELFLIL